MLNVKVFSAGVAAVTLMVGYSFVRKRAKRQRAFQKAMDDINQAFKDREAERTTAEMKSPAMEYRLVEVEAREKRIILLVDPFILCFHFLHERVKWEKERLRLIREKEALSLKLLAAEQKNRDTMIAILEMEEKMEHVLMGSKWRIEVIVSLQEELNREKEKKQEEVLQLIQEKEALAITWDQERLQLIREKEALADKSEQERLRLIQEKESLAVTWEEERLQLVKGKEHLAERVLSAEQQIKQEDRKFLSSHAHKLTLDPATVNNYLSLSENNRKVTRVGNNQPYPCHRDRFVYLPEVRCKEGLTGRCYWEVEWSGVVSISMTNSWYLLCNDGVHGNFYKVNHNGKMTELPVCPSGSNRVGVYLDMPAGTISFYRVSSLTWTHLYNVQYTFTEPFYPGFRCWSSDASVYLCEMDEVG